MKDDRELKHQVFENKGPLDVPSVYSSTVPVRDAVRGHPSRSTIAVCTLKRYRRGMTPTSYVAASAPSNKPSRVSPPASSPRPRLPLGSLWPTSLTLSSSMRHQKDAERESTSTAVAAAFNLQATKLFIVTSATKGVVVTTPLRFRVRFKILYRVIQRLIQHCLLHKMVHLNII